jgi:type IV secretion system protein VirB10
MLSTLLTALIMLQAASGEDGAAPGKPAAARTFDLVPGTKIPLSLLNSVSTRTAVEGDRVYLETVFPIVTDGRVVIPVGSSVAGTVTSVKRAGRVKGRAELFVRFDSIILPNGVMRDFRARASNIDGTNPGKLDREEGKVTGDSNKGGDARTVGEVAMTGTWIGALGGAAAGNTGMGAGIGALAGAAAGLVGVLVTRGPDAVLNKGTTVEMVLDRNLSFEDKELDFSGVPAPYRRAVTEVAPRAGERPGWRGTPGIR